GFRNFSSLTCANLFLKGPKVFGLKVYFMWAIPLLCHFHKNSLIEKSSFLPLGLMASMPRKNNGESGCLSLKCLATGLVKSFLLIELMCSLIRSFRGDSSNPC
uniref:Uncharacterized protein n=1 Tax=Oreochromis aureus TaxID=47969 RepID=A0AAZ1XK48_OREAU